mmetsp:Transcript_64238/g.149428  ORF Transcript_64238/g.149428 Transcript_64238/m.149428 type:complete len:293 (-) Transcript_64238:106-984(-)
MGSPSPASSGRGTATTSPSSKRLLPQTNWPLTSVPAELRFTNTTALSLTSPKGATDVHSPTAAAPRRTSKCSREIACRNATSGTSASQSAGDCAARPIRRVLALHAKSSTRRVVHAAALLLEPSHSRLTRDSRCRPAATLSFVGFALHSVGSVQATVLRTPARTRRKCRAGREPYSEVNNPTAMTSPTCKFVSLRTRVPLTRVPRVLRLRNCTPLSLSSTSKACLEMLFRAGSSGNKRSQSSAAWTARPTRSTSCALDVALSGQNSHGNFPSKQSSFHTCDVKENSPCSAWR